MTDTTLTAAPTAAAVRDDLANVAAALEALHGERQALTELMAVNGVSKRLEGEYVALDARRAGLERRRELLTDALATATRADALAAFERASAERREFHDRVIAPLQAEGKALRARLVEIGNELVKHEGERATLQARWTKAMQAAMTAGCKTGEINPIVAKYTTG